MEYDLFGSDDEDYLDGISTKFNLSGSKNYFDDNNDEYVTPVTTNPFLSQPTTSMGRGIPANYLETDDETQIKLINEAKSRFFFKIKL